MDKDRNKISAVTTLKIACIGCGSLIWDPGDLPLSSEWNLDGPILPVEFARQSGDDHITLVIVESDHCMQTLWAEMRVETLAEAVSVLQSRERVPFQSSIGRWPNQTGKAYPCSDVIGEWAEANKLHGVVWTALPPGMKGSRGSVPPLDELTAHILNLNHEALQKAQIYIANAPAQIVTPYRQALAQACKIALRRVSDQFQPKN